jgi:arabinogalactan oligomer/maltooligosaccharide transport system substrate-binding protein
MDDRIDRRRLLRVGTVAGVGLLAGCSGDGNGDGSTTGSGAGETTSRGAGETPTTADTGLLPADCPEGPVEADEEAGTANFLHLRYEEHEVIEGAIERFETATDHSVETEAIPMHLAPKLEASKGDADGDTPHVFESVHDLDERFFDSEIVIDQSGAVDYPTCQLFDTAVEAAQYRDAVVGVPFAGESVALLYNREMVDSPPETLEEMRAIMAEHHDPDNGQYGLTYPIAPYSVSGFAQAYGGEIYDGEADELGITSDAVKRGLRVVFDELAPYMPDDLDSGPQVETFGSGDAPLLISGPWDVWGSYSHVDAVDEGIDIGVAPLPSLPDGGEPRPYAGIKLKCFGPGMETDPDGAGAARDYAEWIATNEDVLLENAREVQLIPVHRGLLDSGRLPDRIEGFAEQLRDAYPMPQNPKMDAVWGPFGDALWQTFDSDGDLEESLATAEEEIRAEWERLAE